MRRTRASMMSAVSWGLLAAVAVLVTPATIAKSLTEFMSGDGNEMAQRALLNTETVLETDAPITETIVDACQLPGGVEDFFEMGSSGEVCQLAASVIGRGTKRVYTWELFKHHNDISFQVVLQPLEGIPIVTVEHQTENGEWVQQEMTEWSSGNSLIFVLETLNAGQSRVVLESASIVSTFSLRIEFFRADVDVHEDSILVLKFIKEKCCDPNDPCTGVLDLIGTNQESTICTSAGNHCDGEGHLTHLDLSESNMKCDLADADFPLLGLKQLQVFMLNDNNIQGNLNNPNVLERFRDLQRLQILELGNLPGITGSIPDGCTRPFKDLIHLGVSNTSIGGELPPCLVNSVHQLEIANAQFAGRFPEISADAQLRYLLAYTSPGSQFKFTGKLPSLQNAQHLHYANLNNQNFEGKLTLSNNIEAVRVQNNSITEVEVLDAPGLQLVDVSGNQLVGPMPSALAQLPQLRGLHVDGNQLTTLPASWRGDNLRDFTASSNNIEGRVPAAFGSMPHLRRLVLSRNKLGGQLDDFSAAIPQHSKLQWVDLSHNQISGPIFAPALIKLAVFSSTQDEFQTEYDRRDQHVFRAVDNNLIGDVSAELITAYEQQKAAGVHIVVDLRSNGLSCPEAATLEKTNLEAQAIVALGCGSSGGTGGGNARRAVVGTLVAVLLLGLLGGCAVVYKRRRRNTYYKDPAAFTAAQYANEAEASSRNGSGQGWFTGRPSTQQYASSLDDPGQGKSWGFLPFMNKSKQPVSSLLGNTGWSNQTPSAAYQGMPQGNGMQLPVSNDRRNLSVNVGGQRHGAAVTSVELVSPRSDVSGGSLPRNGGGINGFDDHDDGSDGSRSERQMRVAFNAAYTPVGQDHQ